MTLTLDFVKGKSAARLVGLHPVVKMAAERLVELTYAAGVPIVITQGYRSIAEQDALYAQGRTKPGKIVTNARGGYSNHNFGVAIDFAILLPPDGKQVSWDMLRDGNANGRRDWDEAVEIAKQLGFTWGGDWKSFVDTPHFEMTFGISTANWRAGRRPTAAQETEAMARIVGVGVDKKEEEPEMDKVAVTVNGKAIVDGLLDAKNGITYVPVRAVAEAWGAVVAWDKAANTVRITK